MESEKVDFNALWNRIEFQVKLLKSAEAYTTCDSRSFAQSVLQLCDLYLQPRTKCLLLSGSKVQIPCDIDMNEAISQFTMTLVKMRREEQAYQVLSKFLSALSANEPLALKFIAEVIDNLSAKIHLPVVRMKDILTVCVAANVMTDADVESVIGTVDSSKKFCRLDEITVILKDKLAVSKSNSAVAATGKDKIIGKSPSDVVASAETLKASHSAPPSPNTPAAVAPDGGSSAPSSGLTDGEEEKVGIGETGTTTPEKTSVPGQSDDEL